MNANSVCRVAIVSILSLIVFSLCPLIANAADIIAFAGIQHANNITVDTGGSSGLVGQIKEFDAKTFGVFGGRYAHGKLLGGEYTAQYSPNFIVSDSNAWMFHGNVRVQIPYLVVIRPYATAGIGLVNSSGSSNSIGTEFLVNYGGGIIFSLGLVGLNFDVRGYTIPNAHIPGVTVENNINLIQPSIGLVFSFK